MDDNLNQNATQDSTSTPQPEPVSVTPSSTTYAGFFERFVAVLIDAVLVGFVAGAISAVSGSMGDFGKSLGSLIAAAISVTYYVYFISQRGQTLGKKAMHLRVQSESTGQNLDVVSAILREVVGKFLSGVVLFLGYFWMLWDDKKQTWHDKIAKSVVVKVD
jgi:uncharacterized RDD family membrane protein YckC